MRRTLNKVALTVITVSGAVLAVPYIMDAVAPPVVATHGDSHAKVESVSTNWFRQAKAKGKRWQETDASTIALAESADLGSNGTSLISAATGSSSSILIDGFTKDVTVSMDGASNLLGELSDQMKQADSKTIFKNAVLSVSDAKRNVNYVITVSGSWDSTAAGKSVIVLRGNLESSADIVGGPPAGTIMLEASISDIKSDESYIVSKGKMQLNGIDPYILASLISLLPPGFDNNDTLRQVFTISQGDSSLALQGQNSLASCSLSWSSNEEAICLEHCEFNIPLQQLGELRAGSDDCEMKVAFQDWKIEWPGKKDFVASGQVELELSGSYAKAHRLAYPEATVGALFSQLPFASLFDIEAVLARFPVQPEDLIATGQGVGVDELRKAFWDYLAKGSTDTQSKTYNFAKEVGPECAKQLKALGDQIFGGRWRVSARNSQTFIDFPLIAQFRPVGSSGTLVSCRSIKGDISLGDLVFKGFEYTADASKVLGNPDLVEFARHVKVSEPTLAYVVPDIADDTRYGAWGIHKFASTLSAGAGPSLSAVIPFLQPLIADPTGMLITYDANNQSEDIWHKARSVLEPQFILKNIQFTGKIDSVELGKTKLLEKIDVLVNPQQDAAERDVAFTAGVEGVDIQAILQVAKPILAFRSLANLKEQKAILSPIDDSQNYMDSVLLPAWDEAIRTFKTSTSRVEVVREKAGRISFDLKDNGTHFSATVHLDPECSLAKRSDTLLVLSPLDIAPGRMPRVLKHRAHPHQLNELESETPTENPDSSAQSSIENSKQLVREISGHVDEFVEDVLQYANKLKRSWGKSQVRAKLAIGKDTPLLWQYLLSQANISLDTLPGLVGILPMALSKQVEDDSNGFSLNIDMDNAAAGMLRFGISGPDGSFDISIENAFDNGVINENSKKVLLVELSAKDAKGRNYGTFSYKGTHDHVEATGDAVNFARIASLVKSYPIRALSGMLEEVSNNQELSSSFRGRLLMGLLNGQIAYVNSLCSKWHILGKNASFQWKKDQDATTNARTSSASFSDPKGFNLTSFTATESADGKSYEETLSGLLQLPKDPDDPENETSRTIWTSAHFKQEDGEVTGQIADLDVAFMRDLVFNSSDHAANYILSLGDALFSDLIDKDIAPVSKDRSLESLRMALKPTIKAVRAILKEDEDSTKALTPPLTYEVKSAFENGQNLLKITSKAGVKTVKWDRGQGPLIWPVVEAIVDADRSK